MRLAPLIKRSTSTLWPGATGADVAWLFQRGFATVSLLAWVSLGVQVCLLIGPRGLLPLAEFVSWIQGEGAHLPGLVYPSILRWTFLTGEGVLLGGTIVGALLATLAIFGVWPRLSIALSTLLYLSYVAATRDFTAFQWDNLLLECGFLCAFLPTNYRAPLVHLLLRLVLFKLYFESGIAKWTSVIGDWQDGSAMTFYYETAPLPTWPAFFAHNLPARWHAFESWATLFLELVVPFFAFGPRFLRLVAFFSLTGLQIINMTTANYGFFVFLALLLHVFLLNDTDAAGLVAWCKVKLGRFAGSADLGVPVARWRSVPVWAFAVFFVFESTAGAIDNFTSTDLTSIEPLRRNYLALRAVNTYHLFASVTRERIEPEVQTLGGGQWRSHHMRHKPGDPARAPDFIAPHQPRVDFLLWFYGLGYTRGAPPYVHNLLDRVCNAPEVVQPLFAESLPAHPEAVRLAFYRYNFNDRETLSTSGYWWKRQLVDVTNGLPCRPGPP